MRSKRPPPALVAGTGRLALLIPRCGSRGADFGAIVGFLFLAFLVVFFLFFFRGKDVLAALFGGNDFVFVDVFNLRNPAIGVALGIERFFFED